MDKSSRVTFLDNLSKCVCGEIIFERQGKVLARETRKHGWFMKCDVDTIVLEMKEGRKAGKDVCMILKILERASVLLIINIQENCYTFCSHYSKTLKKNCV